jgi:hypothetical protein
MAETEKAKPAATKKAPKGGRKGGTLFPKINLKQALDYSKKLVAKTHTGPQPEQTILPGVFGSAGPTGKVRASALKQFGLLEGGTEAYQATPLAKQIDGAPPEDRAPLLQRALRSSKLFNQIFETFHGDTVSKAKIEQRARGLNVHPESAVECAQLFIDSAVTAGLGTINDDSIALAASGAAAAAAPEQEEREEQPGQLEADEADAAAAAEAAARDERPPDNPAGRSKPAVSINVDSTSDPDKLEKQLKLLREYGLI